MTEMRNYDGSTQVISDGSLLEEDGQEVLTEGGTLIVGYNSETDEIWVSNLEDRTAKMDADDFTDDYGALNSESVYEMFSDETNVLESTERPESEKIETSEKIGTLF